MFITVEKNSPLKNKNLGSFFQNRVTVFVSFYSSIGLFHSFCKCRHKSRKSSIRLKRIKPSRWRKMPRSDEQWFTKSQVLHYTGNRSSNRYNSGISESQKDYEDPEYYYSRPHDLPQVITLHPFETWFALGIKFKVNVISHRKIKQRNYFLL